MRLTSTAGRRHDSVPVPDLSTGLGRTVVVADRAYDGDPIRDLIAATGAAARIPPHPDRNWPFPFSPSVHRNHELVERFFGRLEQFRKVATRFEKRPDTYLGLCRLAAVVIHL